ncbi:hypothetical protein [Phenylobacterium sp.]|uniref:hypothetical protein n=1 Tax=Phenylobacterium sp. TaxID=1871053 RepID=UPI002ED89C1E
MSSAKNPPSPGRPLLAVSGALCLLAGLAGLAALAVAVYGGAPSNHAWALRLGLAGSLLASAAAQVLVLIGGWALWRGLRRRP